MMLPRSNRIESSIVLKVVERAGTEKRAGASMAVIIESILLHVNLNHSNLVVVTIDLFYIALIYLYHSNLSRYLVGHT